jgi:heat shock protein HtpX
MAKKWMLDDQIRHNKRATVRLFIFMFILLWAIAFSIGVVLGYPPIITGAIALIFGSIYLMGAGSGSVELVLKAARARPIRPQVRAEKLLDYAVEEMALAAGIPKPRVFVQDSADINAFATGRKPEEGVICITTGALAQLNNEEMQGVIAHEMAHIKNYDIRIATYAIAIIGLIAMIGEMLWWGLFFGRGGGRRGGDARVQAILFVVAIALIILAPIISRVTYLAISRKREYLADATGAQLTRNPEGLASALAKIGAREPEDHHGGDRTVASLYLANPFKRVRKNSLFATHPPIDERVDRLRRM